MAKKRPGQGQCSPDQCVMCFVVVFRFEILLMENPLEGVVTLPATMSTFLVIAMCFCLHKQDSGIRWIACFSLFSQSFMTMMGFVCYMVCLVIPPYIAE